MSELRAINAETGEVIQLPGSEQVVALRAQVETLEEELELQKDLVRMERDVIRKLRARNSELTGERNQSEQMDPHWNDAVEVYEYWKFKLKKGAKEFTDERSGKVLARLHAGHTKDDLFQAIDGCARLPYVTDDKGRTTAGKKSERRVELELICRSEAHVDRFRSYVEDEVPTSTPLRVVDPSKELREAFLAHPGALLASRHGDPVRATGFCMECALEHREGIGTLDDGVLRCSNGCTHDVQAKALLDWYRHSGLVRCGECGARKAAA